MVLKFLSFSTIELWCVERWLPSWFCGLFLIQFRKFQGLFFKKIFFSPIHSLLSMDSITHMLGNLILSLRLSPFFFSLFSLWASVWEKSVPWVSLLGLMKSGELWEHVIGPKRRYELSSLNWSRQRGLFFKFLSVFLSSEIRVLLSSGYREGTLHLGGLWPASRKVTESLLHLLFLKFLQLEIVNMPRCYVLG